jgi:hypothetical protein
MDNKRDPIEDGFTGSEPLIIKWPRFHPNIYLERIRKMCVRFEVFMAVTMKNAISRSCYTMWLM